MEKQKLPKARNLYLIVRGEKSEHHNAPFHPVIVCSRKHTAQWEVKEPQDGATLFYNLMGNDAGANWGLGKYKGYDCDANHYFELFDGVNSKDITSRDNIFSLLKGAIWWSYDECPQWLLDAGVKYPEDKFTKQVILEDSGTCIWSHSKETKYWDNLEEKYDQPDWLK